MNKKTTSVKSSKLDELSVNTIRFLSIDAVEKANSGHPGMPMGAAPMAYVLWTRLMKYNPADPGWFDRDRFILSAGHGSMLLYSLLHLTGYAVSLDDIKKFRQWDSRTPGHPERGIVPGVEVTTGPLGQGFANGVGMAIAESYLATRYNRPGFKIIDHYTYAIVSDGDLMEGVASEAASLAGHLGLGKLIYLYDDNHITLAASTDVAFTEDRAKRLASYGWHTQTVRNGNDLDALNRALLAARREKHRPSIIMVRTHIGYGSPNKQDTYEAHGSPLGENEVKLTKENLGWPLDPAFYIPGEVLAHCRKALDRGKKAQAGWEATFAAYARAFPEQARELDMLIQGGLPQGWDRDIPVFPADAKGVATRVVSGTVLNKIAPALPHLFGGSCDLNPSTRTALSGMGDFENPGDKPGDPQGSIGASWSFGGRNIHFGVREHAMGSALNGMAAHGGILPFGSTFLIFSDYMRPPIRLAALMGLQVIYVFTHDSISVGEDGPTHQPVEQLASLRAIPGLTILRPCDANETAEAWRVAVEMKGRPVVLVLTRQNVPTLDRTALGSAQGLRRGAYILADSSGGSPDMLLIASGSEVSLVMEVKKRLDADGIRARVVSMPSMDLFESQPEEYKNAVLPAGIKARLTVEAGSTQGWHRYAGEQGASIGIDRFGASAPGTTVMREYGLSADNVYNTAREVMGRIRGA